LWENWNGGESRNHIRYGGVKFLRTEGGRSLFDVASGTYQFSGMLAR
jgi:hypothetical protein